MNFLSRNWSNRNIAPKEQFKQTKQCRRTEQFRQTKQFRQTEPFRQRAPFFTGIDFEIFKSYGYCVLKTLEHRKYIVNASKKMYPICPTKNDIVNTYPPKYYNKKSVMSTTDSVVLAEGKVLLIKRKKEPYKNKWAFPGGRIEITDKDISSSAVRELREETNLDNVDLKYFGTIGNSTRDPRGFYVTNIYVTHLKKIPNNIKAGDGAMICNWFDVSELPSMAFDHREIMNEIIKKCETSDT